MEFDICLDYKLDKEKSVADTLNKNAELAAVCQLKGNLLDQIMMGIVEDLATQGLVKLVCKGKTQRLWLKDDLLYIKGNWVFVPCWGNLRKELLKKCHYAKWAGDPGQWRTLALLEATYIWPKVLKDAEDNVRTCLFCQQDKVDHQ